VAFIETIQTSVKKSNSFPKANQMESKHDVTAFTLLQRGLEYSQQREATGNESIYQIDIGVANKWPFFVFCKFL